MNLTCRRCRTRFESPLLSRYCSLCRGHLVRTLLDPECFVCKGVLWTCSAHNATPFDECCGAPIVACICNPEMKSPPNYHCMSDICMGITP